VALATKYLNIQIFAGEPKGEPGGGAGAEEGDQGGGPNCPGAG